MKTFEQLVEGIAIELDAIAQKVEKDIIKRFPENLSYDFLTGHPRYLSHDLDPPWDRSGQLFSKLSENQFDVNHYEKVRDFFEEYTGNSTVSYLSGCGRFHETYGDYYIEWITELFSNAHYTVLQEQEPKVLTALASELFEDVYIKSIGREGLAFELIDEIEEFKDDSYLSAENLCMKLGEMDLLFVYKLGEKRAKEQLIKERIAMENRKKQIDMEQSAFNKLWSLLEKKYRLAYQQTFPHRIDMHEFESFEQFLNEHKVQQKERILIGKYAPIQFSNSVAFKLTAGE